MKAIVALLKSLPLQPENVESDITEAKSSLFLKYVVFGQFLFNFFQCFLVIWKFLVLGEEFLEERENVFKMLPIHGYQCPYYSPSTPNF